MRTKALIAFCIMMLSASAVADEVSKTAKLKELMELQKLTEVVEERRARSREQVKEMAPQMSKAFQIQAPNASQADLAEADAAYATFVDGIDAAWSTEDVIHDWGRLYGEHVTEDELDQIIAFYRSPVGMKNALATHNAMPQWQAFLAQRSQSAMEAALVAYVERLREIAQRVQAAKGGE